MTTRKGHGCLTSRRTAIAVAGLALAVLFVASTGLAQDSMEPKGLHVNFGAEPASTAVVSWIGPPAAEAQVEYEGPSGETRTVEAQAHEIPGSDRVAYRAEVTGLEAETRYNYTAVLDGTSGPSHVFETAPRPESEGPVDLTMFADHGVPSDSLGGTVNEDPVRVTERAASLNATVNVVGGDLAYANGSPRAWSDYVTKHEPVYAEVPTMTVPGPADRDPGTGWARYDALFPMPTPDDVGRWWSVQVGQLFLIGLNSDTACVEGQATSAYPPAAFECAASEGPAYRPNERQLAFLENQLEAAREEGVNWIVVVSHYPPWSDGENHGSYHNIRDFWGPVFEEYGVDLVLSGADHFYERSKPIVGDEPVENGTMYVVSGAGGNGLYPYENDEPPDWEAARHNDAYGLLQLNFTEGYARGSFVTAEGQRADRFALENVEQGVRSVSLDTLQDDGNTTDANRSAPSDTEDTPGPGPGVALVAGLAGALAATSSTGWVRRR